MTHEEHVTAIKDARIAYNLAVKRAYQDGIKVKSTLCGNSSVVYSASLTKEA